MTDNMRSGGRRLSAEGVSTRVLYVLVALAVVLFGAFFLVGYDVPYENNPAFNAPRLTDAVLVFIYLTVLAASAAAACSIVRGVKARGKAQRMVNNIPAARITWFTVALLAGCMLITFLLGSAEPVTVNGVEFADTFWLKATDMFINTSTVLLLVAVCGVAYGLSGYNRKLNNRKK